MRNQSNAILKNNASNQKEARSARFNVVNSGAMLEPLSARSVKGNATTRGRKSNGQDDTSSSNDFVIRDTFSIPPKEYGKIEVIRMRLAREGYIYSKSEVIRAGLLALDAMHNKEMVMRLNAVEKVKPGRKI